MRPGPEIDEARIHGRKVVASLKVAQDGQVVEPLGLYPRPKGRGLIEGAASSDRPTRDSRGIHGRKVVASLKGVPHQEVVDVAAGIHGRKVVASLKGGTQGVQTGLGRTRIHGRKVVASLKVGAAGLAAGRGLVVSTAERSWPH